MVGNRIADPKRKNPVSQLFGGAAADLLMTGRMSRVALIIRRCAMHGTICGGGILCAALFVYSLELNATSKINDWWIDELFSLTATDPRRTFAGAFANWIFTESNPPLYYSGLYAIRSLIVDDRTATLVLNAFGIFSGAAAVAVSSRRAGMLGCGMIAIAAVLLSGPVVRYSLEARGYLLAMQIVFVASWFCCLAVRGSRSPTIISFGIIGALGALTHVFAALMCSSLAAGIITVAVLYKRRELFARGVALVVATIVVLAIWIPFGLKTVHNLDWITFDLNSTMRAAKGVGALTIGGGGATLARAMVLLFAILLCAGLCSRTTRAIAITSSIALTLFVLVPIMLSFKQPIIVAKYWDIGFPVAIVFSIFICFTWLSEGIAQRRMPIWIGACAAAAFVLISDVVGFSGAEASVANKMVWSGAPIVAEYALNCPPRSVHVLGALLWLYAKSSGAPIDIFVDAASPETPIVTVPEAKCRVLGWAEHNVEIMMHPDITNDAILHLLKIEASAADVEVRRHLSGFIVLRRN
jgi:hypothetical protein